MKLKIFTLILAVLFAGATSAQTTFSVPERTPEQQYKRAVSIMHYQMVCAINYGKAMNQSVAETGKYFGNLYKTTWNAEGGFNDLVKWTIFNLNDFSGKVEIISQSTDKVVIKVTNLNEAFKNQQEIYGVTFKEYVEFYQSSHNPIAEMMKSKILFKIIPENNLEVTFKKAN